jgi:predicted SAM-dependent methyltransferase
VVYRQHGFIRLLLAHGRAYQLSRSSAPTRIEIRRILKPGGALRFVVPGIERIIRAYVANDKEFFKEQEHHHPPNCTTKMEHLMYPLQQNGEHKYGYDFETAQKFLKRAGFTKITDSAYNESEFPELRVDYRGENLSLFVDAIK